MSVVVSVAEMTVYGELHTSREEIEVAVPNKPRLVLSTVFPNRKLLHLYTIFEASARFPTHVHETRTHQGATASRP